jgi:transposase
MLKTLLNMPELRLNNIEHIDTTFKISASSKSNRSKCTNCAKYSYAIHGRYTRTIVDLAVFENKTILYLVTRKFKCKNLKCPQKVFSEQLPYARKYARRTLRVSKTLELLSIELTCAQGSILSNTLMFPVSNSTLLRIAHKLPLPQIKQPKVLGIDDWAYRKGVSYGTILIDMETSTPIDLLDSREGSELKTWLSKYPDVKIVTRDRASAYSSAVNQACPDAVQVADRFHLYMNLSDALDKYFKSIGSKIRDVVRGEIGESSTCGVKHEQANKPGQQVSNASTAYNDSRLLKFNQVKELQKKNTSNKRISKSLGMGRATVLLYKGLEALPPRERSTTTNINSFTNHILEQLKIEGMKVKDIIKGIKKAGFNGKDTQAYHHINRIKKEFKIEALGFKEVQQQPVKYTRLLSAREMVKYIDLEYDKIQDPYERNYIKTLVQNISEIHIVKKLVQLFKSMLKTGIGNLQKWIQFIKKSKHKLYGLKSFANGLTRDFTAVQNGIKMKWSNGAVEGHVNRIKTIKRQMYGRAGFELLRKKIILSKTG